MKFVHLQILVDVVLSDTYYLAIDTKGFKRELLGADFSRLYGNWSSLRALRVYQKEIETKLVSDIFCLPKKKTI